MFSLPAVVRGSIVLCPGGTVFLARTGGTGVISGDIKCLPTLKGDIVDLLVCDEHGFPSILFFDRLFRITPWKKKKEENKILKKNKMNNFVH